jgi:hypothetical protein
VRNGVLLRELVSRINAVTCVTVFSLRKNLGQSCCIRSPLGDLSFHRFTVSPFRRDGQASAAWFEGHAFEV